MHISKFRLSMNLINVNGSLYMKLYTVASFIFKKGLSQGYHYIWRSLALKSLKISSQPAASDILMNSIFSWENDLIFWNIYHWTCLRSGQPDEEWSGPGVLSGPVYWLSIMIEDMCCFRNISGNTHLMWYFIKITVLYFFTTIQLWVFSFLGESGFSSESCNCWWCMSIKTEGTLNII